MNKKVPEITESVEDLKGLLRQAKKKHEIQRLNALYLQTVFNVSLKSSPKRSQGASTSLCLIMVVFIKQNH